MSAETTREFFMWGHPTEIVAKVKHRNGTIIEVPITSDITYNPSSGYSSITIPLHGQWFDKIVETTRFSTQKRGW